MPAPRKTWFTTGEKPSSKPISTLSTAELLAMPRSQPSPSIPMWALAASFTALLGRDNRKIPSTRTEKLLNTLLDFVLLLHAVEAQGIKFDQAMKDQWVEWFTRDVLTTKPAAHLKHVLGFHSRLVDVFLQGKGWPVTIESKQQRYESALRQHLPGLFSELANVLHCNPTCPGRVFLDSKDVKKFTALNSFAALRDAIVAFHHGIGPDTMRGARAGRRVRRHRKE